LLTIDKPCFARSVATPRLTNRPVSFTSPGAYQRLTVNNYVVDGAVAVTFVASVLAFRAFTTKRQR
jgi:hypothetical protein